MKSYMPEAFTFNFFSDRGTKTEKSQKLEPGKM